MGRAEVAQGTGEERALDAAFPVCSEMAVCEGRVWPGQCVISRVKLGCEGKDEARTQPLAVGFLGCTDMSNAWGVRGDQRGGCVGMAKLGGASVCDGTPVSGSVCVPV